MKIIKHYQGFTTAQLMIVVAITSIISALAVPAYSKVIVEQYKTTALNAFHHSVLLAKTEAIKSLEHIVICPSNDNENCKQDSNDFSGGWIMFINKDKDYPVMRDNDEQLLHTVKLKNSEFDLVSNRKTYTFRPVGKRNTNGTLMFCPKDNSIKYLKYQAVIVSYTGRPRVDHKPKKSHLEICD